VSLLLHFPSFTLLIGIYTYSFIRSSMALQPLIGPQPLLQFRNFFYTDGRTPWTRDQPIAWPLPTNGTTQTQNKSTHKHPCLEWDIYVYIYIYIYNTHTLIYGIHTHTLTHRHSLSQTHTHTHVHTHTCSHTHTLSHYHRHAHCLTHILKMTS
jgi:hypothetical protein